MENFISFLPIVAFSLIGSVLFYLKKITFNNQGVLLLLAAISHALIEINHGSIPFLVGQVLIAVAAFALMVFFFAGKTSGETILTMSSLLLLSPVPDGIIPLLGVFLILIVVTAIELRKQSESIKLALFDAAVSTGLSHSSPDYSHLPARSDLSSTAKRSSLLPYICAVMTLASLYYLVQPLFMDS